MSEEDGTAAPPPRVQGPGGYAAVLGTLEPHLHGPGCAGMLPSQLSGKINQLRG